MRKYFIFFLVLSVFAFREAIAQNMEKIKPLSLSGYRIGQTFIVSGAEELEDAVGDSTVFPIVAQFGWQFERQYPAGEGGLAAVVEVVPLLGGFNLGLIIPSVTFIVGIRTGAGYELGAGPVISLGGSNDDPKLSSGFVFAGGLTKRYGKLNIPLNFAIAQTKTSGAAKSSIRLTLLTGFTL